MDDLKRFSQQNNKTIWNLRCDYAKNEGDASLLKKIEQHVKISNKVRQRKQELESQRLDAEESFKGGGEELSSKIQQIHNDLFGILMSLSQSPNKFQQVTDRLKHEQIKRSIAAALEMLVRIPGVRRLN